MRRFMLCAALFALAMFAVSEVLNAVFGILVALAMLPVGFAVAMKYFCFAAVAAFLVVAASRAGKK